MTLARLSAQGQPVWIDTSK